MRDFEFVVRDERYAVSTRLKVSTRDEAAARELAEAALKDSPRSVMIEVWEHQARVFSIGARTPWTDPSPLHA